MKNLSQVILEHLITKTGKEHFTIKEIYNHIHNPKDNSLLEILQAKSTADQPIFLKNYLASVFFNNCTKSKKPKIQRQDINRVYHYSLKV